jgi:hypothetical protein
LHCEREIEKQLGGIEMKIKTSAFAVAGALIAVQFAAAGAALAHRVHHHHVHHYHHHHGRAVAAGVATGVVINSANRSSICRDYSYRCNRGWLEYCVSYNTQCW